MGTIWLVIERKKNGGFVKQRKRLKRVDNIFHEKEGAESGNGGD